MSGEKRSMESAADSLLAGASFDELLNKRRKLAEQGKGVTGAGESGNVSGLWRWNSNQEYGASPLSQNEQDVNDGIKLLLWGRHRCLFPGDDNLLKCTCGKLLEFTRSRKFMRAIKNYQADNAKPDVHHTPQSAPARNFSYGKFMYRCPDMNCNETKFMDAKSFLEIKFGVDAVNLILPEALQLEFSRNLKDAASIEPPPALVTYMATVRKGGSIGNLVVRTPVQATHVPDLIGLMAQMQKRIKEEDGEAATCDPVQ